MINRFKSRPSFWMRLLARVIHWMPEDLRNRFLRGSLKFPQQLDPQLRIKLAETQDEFTQAFKLLHDTYLDAKLIHPDPSGLRITPYHALPMTKTVIALLGQEVVACISLTPDSQYGLPMANSFDLSELRRSDRRIVEVFGLAIRADVRQHYGMLLFPMFKFVFHLLEKCLRADYAVIAVHPKALTLYESVLLFTPMLNQGGQAYGFIDGQPTLGAYLNVKTYRLALASHYKDASPEQSPLAFINSELSNLELPVAETYQVTQPSMQPETLDYFFNQRTNVFSRLTPDKLNLIASLYNQDYYAEVFPGSETHKRSLLIAREPRFHVELQARCVSLDGRMLEAVIHDASLSGFKAEIRGHLNFGDQVLITIAIGEFDIIDVRAIPVRQGPSFVYGFQIAQAQQGWKYFIELLEQEQLQQRFGGVVPSILRITKVS